MDDVSNFSNSERDKVEKVSENSGESNQGNENESENSPSSVGDANIEEETETKSLGRYEKEGFKEITMEKPKEIDATGIERPWRLDQKGYFLIKVNKDLNKIEAAFCDLKENKVRIIIRGDNPVEVYTAILKEELITRLDHAADIGVELEKAYIALKTGKKYTQDSELSEEEPESSDPPTSIEVEGNVDLEDEGE